MKKHRWFSIQNYLLAYQNESFSLQQKARFFLYSYILGLLALIAAFSASLYSSFLNPALGYKAETGVLITFGFALVFNLIGVSLLIRGFFSLASQILIICGMATVWVITLISNTYAISKIHNSIYLIVFMAFLPLVFDKKPLRMLLYAGINIALVVTLAVFFNNELHLEKATIVSYVANTSIALLSIGFISFYTHTFNQAALKKAETDILQKEKARKELQKISQAVEQSPVITVITNKWGKIEYVNQKFCETTGYSSQEAIGNTPRMLKSGYQSEDFYRDMWNTILSGNVWKGEICNKKKNGEIYWEYAFISPLFDEKGGITHFVGMKEDITQKKAIQEELSKAKDLAEDHASRVKAIIENTTDNIWAFDRDYNILYINNIFRQEFTQAFGVELYPGDPLLGSLPPSIQPMWKDRYDRVLSGETIRFEDAIVAVDSTIYIEVHMHPIRQDGKVTGASCFGRNITQKKLEELELIAAKDRAQKSEERLQSMYYELQISEEETRAANEELHATTDALVEKNAELDRALRSAEESEAKHKLLFDNMIQGVIYHNPDGQIEFANPAAARILGLQDGSLSGRSSADQRWEATDKDGNPMTPEDFPDQVTFRTLQPVTDFQMRVAIPEINSHVWLNINTIPIFEDDRKTLRQVIVTFEDITRKRQADEEKQQRLLLERKVAVAEESLRFKQNFLANMSHEIRTPLTGILGMTEILSKTPLTTEQTNYLQTIRHSGTNLREIINSVLDFSKIEAGKLTLHQRVFPWTNVMQHARNLFQSLNRKPIVFEVECDPNMPPYLEADEYRWVQILTNLISNAVKFTHKGEIRLICQLLQDSAPGDFCEIKMGVKDTGIGIPEEKQHQLFQPFSQIDHSDIRPSEGTGLGLSICRELVKLFQGKIWVESQPDAGSTFWFTVKVKKASAIHGIKEPVKPLLQKQNLCILLAEDKEVNQVVIKLLLNSMGHQVDIASNGKKVLEVFVPGKYDLILMDIQMPEMDGITATQRLREQYDSLPPIVGLSANAFEGDREKYMAQGLDEYLTKPFVEEDFLDVIEKLFSDTI